mgnify:FL=1
MTLPYEHATSGQRALGEIQKLLRSFGCNKFGSMSDDEAQEILVQFEYRGRPVGVRASIRGYAAAWLKQNPPKIFKADLERGTADGKRLAAERKAMNIASVAVYSILRDWIKGQITAIEIGILTFEGAFLGQILLPSGKTVLEHASAVQLLPQIQAPTA